jgi:hypothetical protein
MCWTGFPGCVLSAWVYTMAAVASPTFLEQAEVQCVRAESRPATRDFLAVSKSLRADLMIILIATGHDEHGHSFGK